MIIVVGFSLFPMYQTGGLAKCATVNNSRYAIDHGTYSNYTDWVMYNNHIYNGYTISYSGKLPNGSMWFEVHQLYSFLCKGFP